MNREEARQVLIQHKKLMEFTRNHPETDKLYNAIAIAITSLDAWDKVTDILEDWYKREHNEIVDECLLVIYEQLFYFNEKIVSKGR